MSRPYFPSRALGAALALALLLALPGCATKNPGEPLKTSRTNVVGGELAIDDSDPLEGLNRGLFRFNEILDGVLLKPVAHIYRGVVPDVAQTGVRNVLTNLASPVVFLNSVLQADATNAGRTFGRFVINSTVGIAGIFDVASKVGIPRQHAKDFGQTLGVYGIGTGPFLEVPIIGPSDTRDVLGLVVDIFSDPFNYILTRPETYARDGIDFTRRRADLIPLTDQIYRDSLDPYTSFRSIYLQHRAKVVRDYRTRDSALEKATGK